MKITFKDNREALSCPITEDMIVSCKMGLQPQFVEALKDLIKNKTDIQGVELTNAEYNTLYCAANIKIDGCKDYPALLMIPDVTKAIKTHKISAVKRAIKDVEYVQCDERTYYKYKGGKHYIHYKADLTPSKQKKLDCAWLLDSFNLFTYMGSKVEAFAFTPVTHTLEYLLALISTQSSLNEIATLLGFMVGIPDTDAFFKAYGEVVFSMSINNFVVTDGKIGKLTDKELLQIKR